MSATAWSDPELGEDMAELLPTGTVTLLLADVEGSTQLWESQPEAMSDALARMNHTVAELIAEHDGVRPVEQGEGDSFVLAFARTADAVVCALDLQRAALAPIRLRIGLHTGDVQLRDEGNYAGTTINKAARLRDLAHGGQTVLSAATEAIVEDRLPEESWLIDLGSHQLRGLPRPVRVAQLCHPDLCNEFPPLHTTNSAAAHRLPVQLTTFVGRTAQVVDVRSSLSDNRLVTLTGAGGAGKTRLAIEVAAQMTGEFSDGIWYADLASISHSVVVPLAVARSMGLPDQPGRSITETVVRFVAESRMLLVLDNCEHLLEACAALANDVLAACSQVTILATSREPLIVAGEVTWQVPSLSLADEAIELFSDRARRARPDFSLTDANVETVTEICRRLDGMPLAIELAAARVRSLSLKEIVGSLHDRFRLLTGGARTAVRRQQTLRASVDWSHALLTEPERVLFRRLSVFTSGFDLDAAQAVAGATEVERYQVLDQLSLLIDKSLVSAESASGSTRYRLLETVRQYATEKLSDSGEADRIREAHRDHYTALAARLDAPGRDEYERLVDRAELELANLRAAFVWSRENGELATALEIASSLQPLWLGRGRVLEGLAWLEASGPDSTQGESAFAPALRARFLSDQVVLRSWVDVTGMLELAEEALAIARTIDDPALLSRALVASASITAHNIEVAQPYFTEAIELVRALGDSWRLSLLLGRQAYGTFMAGEFRALSSVADEGRDLAEAIGDGFTSRQCRTNQITVRVYRGDLVGALEMIGKFLAEARGSHDPLATMIGWQMQAVTLAYHGEGTAARAAADHALKAAGEFAGLFDHATHAVEAMACLADGDAQAAWNAVQGALGHSMNPPAETLQTVWLAQAALVCGQLQVARGLMDERMTALKGGWLAMQLTNRAHLNIADDKIESAAEDAYESLSIAHATGIELVLPDIFECLAEISCRAGSQREAVRLLGATDTSRRRMGMVRFKVYDAVQEALLASLRTALGDAAFDTAWAEGAALSTEEAIAYAQRGRGERKRPSSGWESLTPTELDVVRLVGEGLPNKDIAIRLFVSPRTVQSHLRHVYNKLGLASRVQLANESARHVAAP